MHCADAEIPAAGILAIVRAGDSLEWPDRQHGAGAGAGAGGYGGRSWVQVQVRVLVLVQPIANALQGAPRAGAGDWGYRELPAREAGSFIDRIDRDRRA